MSAEIDGPYGAVSLNAAQAVCATAARDLGRFEGSSTAAVHLSTNLTLVRFVQQLTAFLGPCLLMKSFTNHHAAALFLQRLFDMLH